MTIKQEITITSDCTCSHCQKCGICYVGNLEKCEECGRNLDPDMECFGDCWQDSQEQFVALFEQWQEANGSAVWHIIGKRLGWMNLSGYSKVLYDPHDVLDELLINGDFTLDVEFEPKANTLSAVRRSHDETGAYLEILPVEECTHCGEYISFRYDQWLDIETNNEHCVGTLNGKFPHQTLEQAKLVSEQMLQEIMEAVKPHQTKEKP